MSTQKYNKISILRSSDTIKVFLLLAITIWIAHFWHSASFGLYEDDWYRIPNIMEMNVADIGSFISDSLGVKGIKSRLPFLHIFVHVFSFVGLKLKGLHGLYLISYIILTFNSLLFYLLLNRVFANQSFALLGALAFSLFPADTTQPYLTHSLGMQPSLTFLLITFNCYFSGKIKLSYLMIIPTLFTYETAFPVFVAAPLLQKKWNSRLINELLKHILFLGLIIFCVFFLRKVVGEDSVSSFSFWQSLLLIGNPIVGPITSMSMFVYRPLETLLTLRGELLVFLPLYILGLTWVLSQLKLKIQDSEFSFNNTFEKKIVHALKLPESVNNFAKAATIGLSMLILAYPLTLSTVGFSISGRGTRNHFTAVFGASILCACACSFILNRFAHNPNKKRLVILGLAGFFALLVGFGLNVQQDYKLSWQFQRGFWTDIVRLCPDVTDGTVIFVEPSGLPDNRQLLFLRKELEGVPDPKQIKFLSGSDKILPKIYQFPDDWKIPSIVYRLPIDWQQQIVSEGNLLQVSETVAEKMRNSQRTVASSNAIFLETKNGELTRRNKPLIIGKQEFQLKQLSASGSPTFKKRPLYDYLIIPIHLNNAINT